MSVCTTQLFGHAAGEDGKESSIRDKDKMMDLVKGTSKEKKVIEHESGPLGPFEQAGLLILRLRQMTGGLRYMQDKDVAEIFGEESELPPQSTD